MNKIRGLSFHPPPPVKCIWEDYEFTLAVLKLWVSPKMGNNARKEQEQGESGEKALEGLMVSLGFSLHNVHSGLFLIMVLHSQPFQNQLD